MIHVVLCRNLISIFSQGLQLRGDRRAGFLIKLFTNAHVADSYVLLVGVKEEMC